MDRQQHKVTNTGRYAIRVFFWPGTSSMVLAPSDSTTGALHHIDHTDSDPIRYVVEPVE